MSPNPNSDTPVPHRALENAVRNQGPVEPETSLWSGGYSAKAMLGTWLLSLIITIAAIVALTILPLPANLDSKTLWIAAVAVILAWWVIVAFVYMYRRISMHYELTSQRFIHKQGILVRTTDRIDIIDIDDVTFSQGLVERVLGIGTIILTSSDATHPKLILKGIDQVNQVSGMIDDTRRKERRKRSINIESI